MKFIWFILPFPQRHCELFIYFSEIQLPITFPAILSKRNKLIIILLDESYRYNIPFLKVPSHILFSVIHAI